MQQKHSLASWYSKNKINELKGRYITLSDIEPILYQLSHHMQIQKVGISVLEKPIHTITLGDGPKKILMWSQMHGNESTTTKAVFDFLRYLQFHKSAKSILKHCTLCIIPILNPDGAEAYTRLNANEIDLNRDAQNLTQPESVVIKRVFEEFKPDFCFNLHGQRTIYGVGAYNKSSIVSFLTPSEDKERTITTTRKKSMEVIVAIDQMLQKLIPNHVARYDDGFNLNCVGDTFQSLGVPTLLFEAGHFPEDYHREKTRELIFYSLLEATSYISSHTVEGLYTDSYFKIPENRKSFYDIIIDNIWIKNGSEEKQAKIGIMYQELLKNGKIQFIPEIEDKKTLKKSFAHKHIDFQSTPFRNSRFQTFSLHKDLVDILSKI